MAIHFTKTVLFIATETEIHDTESSKWELTSHLTADRKESAFYLGSSHTFTTSEKKLFRLTLFPRVPYVLKSNWAGEPLRCLRSPSQIDACGHRCKINQRRSEPSDTGSAFSSGGVGWETTNVKAKAANTEDSAARGLPPRAPQEPTNSRSAPRGR